jgi:hypothetical protein
MRHKGDFMLKPKLANEFGNPDSADYQHREKAFNAFNTLVAQNPERVVHVMSKLALGSEINGQNQTEKVIEKAGIQVLDTTNNGSQTGFDEKTREQAWAEVFKDPLHDDTAHAYYEANQEDANSPEAIAAHRRNGFATLRVAALLNLEGEERTRAEAALATLHNSKQESVAA